MKKLASKGVKSLLEPPGDEDAMQEVEAEVEAGQSAEKPAEPEVEGIFANGSKVRMVVADVLPLNQVLVKF